MTKQIFSEEHYRYLVSFLERVKRYLSNLKNDSWFYSTHPDGMKIIAIRRLLIDWQNGKISFSSLLSHINKLDKKLAERLSKIRRPSGEMAQQIMVEILERLEAVGSDKELSSFIVYAKQTIRNLMAEGESKSANVLSRFLGQLDLLSRRKQTLTSLRQNIEQQKSIEGLIPMFREGRLNNLNSVDPELSRFLSLISARVSARVALLKFWNHILEKYRPTIEEWSYFASNFRKEIPKLIREIKLYDPSFALELENKQRELGEWYPGWKRFITQLESERYLSAATKRLYSFILSRLRQADYEIKSILSKLRQFIEEEVSNIEKRRKDLMRIVRLEYLRRVKEILRKRKNEIKEIEARLDMVSYFTARGIVNSSFIVGDSALYLERIKTLGDLASRAEKNISNNRFDGLPQLFAQIDAVMRDLERFRRNNRNKLITEQINSELANIWRIAEGLRKFLERKSA